MKVLLTEESTLVLTHQQLLAHLLQKSSLNPDEQNALRGLIQGALPTPIATYINNNLKNVNLMPNEQQQLKNLTIKTELTPQEKAHLTHLFDQSKITQNDLGGLKTLFLKEKKLIDLLKKSALTNSERLQLVHTLQIGTLSLTEQKTLDGLVNKTGLSSEEKPLQVQFVQGPLIANLISKLGLSKDEGYHLRSLIEKPVLNEGEYANMNKLFDKSKLHADEKVLLQSMLGKALLRDLLAKSGLTVDQQSHVLHY